MKRPESPNAIFHLEFGETWLNAQQHDSELYARISPIIDELKRELHRDISNSTTPMARLRNAVEARVVIVRIKENRLNALAITTRAVEQQLERARAEESQAREAERRSGEKSERFAQRLSELNEERLSCDLEQHFELAGDTPCEKPGKSVTSFMVLVEQVKASLKQRLADSQPVSTELPHIGVVSSRRAASGRPLVVHNIALGAREEDVLFAWTITGRYLKPQAMTPPSGA